MKFSIAALLCATGIAVGQVLFKLTAMSLAKTESFLSLRTASWFFAAIAVYGLASLSWVIVLRTEDLGRVYPIMALAFVLVPVASYFVFGERFSMRYFLGVLFIVIGIALAGQK